MAIKKIVTIIILLCSVSLFGGTLEEQRKYRLPKKSEFKTHILASQPLGNLNIHFHGTYQYADIYLDTPTKDLYKTNLSLRFRRRMTDSLVDGYDFQLKNELSDQNPIRMEIDEGDMAIYRVKLAADWVKLTDVLDLLFSYPLSEKTKIDSLKNKNALDALKLWIFQKVDAPIAPFQKLKRLYPKLFTTETLQSIAPSLIGFSSRHRCHVYYDGSDSLSSYFTFPKNRLKKDDSPTYFTDNPNAVWVLETSLDESTFYKLLEHPNYVGFNLSEYEVESKHVNKSIGAEFLAYFEKDLLEQFQLIPTKASKYKQSVDYFTK
jgi:hypothetical protein